MVNLDELRASMVRSGYNQKKLAKAMGLSESALSVKLSKGNLRLEDANAMIKILQISNPAEIFFSE